MRPEVRSVQQGREFDGDSRPVAGGEADAADCRGRPREAGERHLDDLDRADPTPGVGHRRHEALLGAADDVPADPRVRRRAPRSDHFGQE